MSDSTHIAEEIAYEVGTCGHALHTHQAWQAIERLNSAGYSIVPTREWEGIRALAQQYINSLGEPTERTPTDGAVTP